MYTYILSGPFKGNETNRTITLRIATSQRPTSWVKKELGKLKNWQVEVLNFLKCNIMFKMSLRSTCVFVFSIATAWKQKKFLTKVRSQCSFFPHLQELEECNVFFSFVANCFAGGYLNLCCLHLYRT